MTRPHVRVSYERAILLVNITPFNSPASNACLFPPAVLAASADQSAWDRSKRPK